jgi:hypothetical protein
MSQRILYASAYDALDHVVVTCTVYEHDGLGGEPVKVLQASGQVRGVGEPRDGQWTVDALVALLELL